MIKQLIFGLGTGRCGTVSLTKLLNAQPGTKIKHEVYTLPWEPDETKLYNSIHSILGYDSGRVGDVAYYWLPYISRILADYHDAKFICLYRDKESMVRSFINHTPGRNYWTKPDSIHQTLNKWERRVTDLSFPQYNANKPDALGEYWEEYQERTTTWAGLCPNNFKTWPMEILNTREGLSEIFDFIGILERDRIYNVGVRVNVTKEPLTSRHPVTIKDTISCAYCDEYKAIWRMHDMVYGVSVYVCERCAEIDGRIGSLKNSMII